MSAIDGIEAAVIRCANEAVVEGPPLWIGAIARVKPHSGTAGAAVLHDVDGESIEKLLCAEAAVGDELAEVSVASVGLSAVSVGAEVSAEALSNNMRAVRDVGCGHRRNDGVALRRREAFVATTVGSNARF